MHDLQSTARVFSHSFILLYNVNIFNLHSPIFWENNVWGKITHTDMRGINTGYIRIYSIFFCMPKHI